MLKKHHISGEKSMKVKYKTSLYVQRYFKVILYTILKSIRLKLQLFLTFKKIKIWSCWFHIVGSYIK